CSGHRGAGGLVVGLALLLLVAALSIPAGGTTMGLRGLGSRQATLLVPRGDEGTDRCAGVPNGLAIAGKEILAVRRSRVAGNAGRPLVGSPSALVGPADIGCGLPALGREGVEGVGFWNNWAWVDRGAGGRDGVLVRASDWLVRVVWQGIGTYLGGCRRRG